MDLALLELCDQTAELPAPPVAAVDRDAPVPAVEGCWAVGYPLFQEVESAGRETAQVWGIIPPAENLVGGLLSLQVTSAPRALPPRQEALGQSQWSGMSGGGGAGRRAADRRGQRARAPPRRIDDHRDPAGQPRPAACRDRARWWVYLAADSKQLVMLPVPRGRVEPAYRTTLRQLRARMKVLQGRDEELAAIGAFATGQPNPLAPPGSQHAWLTGRAVGGQDGTAGRGGTRAAPRSRLRGLFLDPAHR